MGFAALIVIVRPLNLLFLLPTIFFQPDMRERLGFHIR